MVGMNRDYDYRCGSSRSPSHVKLCSCWALVEAARAFNSPPDMLEEGISLTLSLPGTASCHPWHPPGLGHWAPCRVLWMILFPSSWWGITMSQLRWKREVTINKILFSFGFSLPVCLGSLERCWQMRICSSFCCAAIVQSMGESHIWVAKWSWFYLDVDYVPSVWRQFLV